MHTPFLASLLAFLLTALLLGSRIAARSVPANVQSFYNSVKSTGTCQNILKTGFYAKDDPPNTFSYCGTHLNDYGVIYLQGTGGALADMDIDCDGIQNGPGNDGRCGSSDDTQAHTSFEDTVAGYNKGVSGLNAFIHTYVVLGNVGTNAGFVNYDPRANGVRELSLVAVVCGNGKMFYGIWGDENGDDGPRAVIGEASISMATLCYGTSAVNGNSGHDATDVLYIAFTGAAAVPGANGAKWNAASASEFEASLATLGDVLRHTTPTPNGNGNLLLERALSRRNVHHRRRLLRRPRLHSREVRDVNVDADDDDDDDDEQQDPRGDVFVGGSLSRRDVCDGG
ncbi:hypothetical protein LZ554_007709 [Drepanopeziza brunnea f. sp. 'monogermtubi']|nr:hypothetical protein LZ554_007709 [Drepanopeziza brunnea f. sp. 'monogermtubi']